MKRLCIFVHFDKDDIIDEYVIEYLKKIKHNIDDIIFVTASSPNSSELAKIQPLVKHTLVRENVGYDFGSYRDGFNYAKEYYNLSEYGELILCNDSAFAVNDFTYMLNTMAEKKCDFWGITDCYLVSYHLQSYFLAFKPSIFLNKVFNDFLNNVKTEKTKDDVIHKYEVGFSTILLKHCFKPSVFINIDTFYKKYFCLNGGMQYFPKKLKSFFISKNFKKDNMYLGVKKDFFNNRQKLKKIVTFSFIEYCIKVKSPLLKKNIFIEYYLSCFKTNNKTMQNKHKAVWCKVWNNAIEQIEKHTTCSAEVVKNYIKRMVS